VFAASFAFYAATTVATSLSIGPVIDRIGAVRLLPFYLLSLTAAITVLSLSDAPWEPQPS
jgi:hypothetical protein